MKLSSVAAAGISVAALMGPQATAVAAANNSCPDIQVVFARGTFEAPGVGATGQAFVDALNARVSGKDTVGVYPVSYPASLDFQQAAAGVSDASNEIESLSASCPNTKIVLGGYSQGAAVAGYTTTETVPVGFVLPTGISGPMPPAVATHVAAVVLFGTPSDWVLGLADHSAPPITIGSLYEPKTLKLCAPGDPVCSPGGLDRSAHSAYKSNGMADEAADFVVNAIATAPPAPSHTV
jgi:cutinase